jgi:hypothetical protein
VKEIKFYKTKTGKIPVKDFLDSLSSKHAQKVIWVLELVESLNQVPVQYLKNLKILMTFGRFGHVLVLIVFAYLVL